MNQNINSPVLFPYISFNVTFEKLLLHQDNNPLNGDFQYLRRLGQFSNRFSILTVTFACACFVRRNNILFILAACIKMSRCNAEGYFMFEQSGATETSEFCYNGRLISAFSVQLIFFFSAWICATKIVVLKRLG